LTAYNYKRYKYTDLTNSTVYYAHTSEYADGLSYPGEWEYDKTFVEKPIYVMLDGNVPLYDGDGDKAWYAADVNDEGAAPSYVTYDTLEDTNGKEYTVSGSVNAPNKIASLLVFRKTNADPTQSQLEYVSQTTLGENGEYSFTFKPKDEPSAKTGDFIVMLNVEGGSGPIIIDTIEAPKPIYTVAFVDENGNEIAKQSVVEGDSAILPANPEKEGYNFIGWDESVVNVQRNITATAEFEKKKYNVVFVDWDNNDISIQEFEYGDVLTSDNVPGKDGNTFIGWQNESGEVVATVTDNLILTTKYEKNSYTITFLNWDGGVLSQQVIEYEGTADVPEIDAPAEDNLVFGHWSDSYAPYYVTQSVTLYPVSKFAETVKPVQISLASGVYQTAQTITLSCDTPDAKIFYTTDGTVPEYSEDGTVINGSLYSEALTIATVSPLTAIAYAEGMNPSVLVSEYYRFGQERFDSFAITANGDSLIKLNNTITGSVEYTVINNSGNNEQTADIVLAIYDNAGKLAYMEVKKRITLAEVNNNGSFDSINITNTTASEYTVKLLCWDSITTMKPIADLADFTLIE
jgi:hypothetical protein